MHTLIPPDATPKPAIVTLTHVIYALHTLSVLIGISSLATVVGAFIFGWPSIVAVILNYAKREEARGTYLQSHFRWQIRTFWFALLWCVVGALLALTLLGIPLAVVVFVSVGLWVLYRIARGWLALSERASLPS